MRKAIIFDLDGTLVETKQLHLDALNLTMKYFDLPLINEKYHENKLCGISTKEKIKVITTDNQNAYRMTYDAFFKYVDSSFNEAVLEHFNNKKQEFTKQLLKERIKHDYRLIDLIQRLHTWTFYRESNLLYIQTNCSRETAELMLELAGIKQYFFKIITNEDYQNKPSPEGYFNIVLDVLDNTNFTAEDIKENIVVIGDKLTDITPANLLGLKSIKIDSPNDLTKELFESLGIELQESEFE